MTQVQKLKTELAQFRKSKEADECQNQDGSPIIQGAGKNPCRQSPDRQYLTVFKCICLYRCHMWVCNQTEKEKSQTSQSF